MNFNANPDSYFDQHGTAIRFPPQQDAPAGGTRFKLEFLTDIRPVLANNWLIKGLLPTRGLAAVYGPPGAGKSFVALDAMLHIAAGREWSGRRVKQTGVVYIAAEGGTGIRNRVTAALVENNIPPTAPFALITAAPNLGAEQGDVLELIAAVQAQSEAAQFVPGIVVIDTLARAIAGADENSSRDIGLFVRNADTLARELGCLVLVVHHSGKSAERGMRGSSALHGATDCEWEVGSDETGKSVRIAKMKDGEDGLAWMFRLNSVEVGEDEDGDPVTTCVVEVLNTPEHSARSASTSGKLKGQKASFMTAVTSAIQEMGQPLPSGDKFPAGQRGVKKQDLMRYAEGLNFMDELKPNSKKPTLNRLIRTLHGDGYIGQWGDWIWGQK